MREVEPGEMVIIDSTVSRSFRPFRQHDTRSACSSSYTSLAGQPYVPQDPPPGAPAMATNWQRSTRRTPLSSSRFRIPGPRQRSVCGGSRIPYGEGVIKNRYIHRTFIEPDQRMRDLGVRMKFNPVKETLAGQRSSWSKTASCGARRQPDRQTASRCRRDEVHVRISSPPIKYPCFYGIDMAMQKN